MDPWRWYRLAVGVFTLAVFAGARVWHARLAPREGFLFAFGCPAADCFAHVDSFASNAAAAVSCLRVHAPDHPVAVVYPSKSHHRAVDGATHYVYDRRLLHSGIAAKIYAALVSPFQNSVWLDVDTCVLSDRVLEMFAPLARYDFASAWECCAVGPRPTPALGDGWEPQTGTFAVRRSARGLLRAWAREYGDGRRYPYSSADQNALAKAFDDHSAHRYFVLQPQFNWRYNTMSFSNLANKVGATGSPAPVIVHNHDLDAVGKGVRHDYAVAHKDDLLCELVKSSKPACEGSARSARGSATHYAPVPVFQARLDMPRLLDAEGFSSGVELGVREGGFSKFMLSGWKSCSSYLMVDLWGELSNYKDDSRASLDVQEARLAEALNNTAPWERKRSVCRNFTVACAHSAPDLSFDWVYVDARHSRRGVLEDLDAWWPKLRFGGLMCGHDFVDCSEAAASGQDWCVEEDGSRDASLGAVRGAVEDFAALHQRQVQVAYREPAWNSWCIRK